MPVDVTPQDQERARAIAGPCVEGGRTECLHQRRWGDLCLPCERTAAIATALAEQRERDAKVAEEHKLPCPGGTPGKGQCYRVIAAAIRRGDA